MVKATKLNEEVIAGLSLGDKVVCRKSIVHYGEKCLRKGGVYEVSHIGLGNKLIVHDEYGDMFKINGTKDFSKHFLIYDGEAEDFKIGDKLVLISKVKGKFKHHFKKGKVYEVDYVNLCGEALVKSDIGVIALKGTKDLSKHFVKVK